MKENGAHLLSFYSGTQPDDRGRFLRNILQWSTMSWNVPTITSVAFPSG